MAGTETSDFDAIADVYDELVSWAPYGQWVCDLQRRLASYGLKRGQLLLDVACGTGLSTIPWAERGYRVVGIDRSERMLEEARKKLRGKRLEVEFVRADILTLELPLEFDAALCMHSGMDYFLDTDDLARAFRSLRKRLREGGLLAYDKCLDEPAFYRDPYSDSHKISCGEAVFHYSWDRGRRLFEQRCAVHRSGEGGATWCTAVVHRMMAVPLQELIELTESAGFKLLEPPRQFTVADPGMGIFRAV